MKVESAMLRSLLLCTKYLIILAEQNSSFVKFHFYPTALKGCRGIVFTHGVWMGRQAGGQAAGKVCLACISGTVRCRKLILGRDIG